MAKYEIDRVPRVGLDNSTIPTSDELAAAGGAAMIGNTPAGTIAATTTQGAINELATEKTQASTLADTGGAAAVGINNAAFTGPAAGTTTAQAAIAALDAAVAAIPASVAILTATDDVTLVEGSNDVSLDFGDATAALATVIGIKLELLTAAETVSLVDGLGVVVGTNTLQLIGGAMAGVLATGTPVYGPATSPLGGLGEIPRISAIVLPLTAGVGTLSFTAGASDATKTIRVTAKAIKAF